MKPATTIFLTLVGITAAVWIMRGMGLLTFFPGGVIWVLLFLSIGTGIVDMLQRTRRW